MLRPQWDGDRWQSGVGNRGETVFTVMETGGDGGHEKELPRRGD